MYAAFSPPEFQKDTRANRKSTMLKVRCLSEKEAAFSKVTSDSLIRSQLEFSSCVSQRRGLASHHITHANSLCCGISILNKVLITTSSELKGEVAMITCYSFK